jgi:hypothetical protein
LACARANVGHNLGLAYMRQQIFYRCGGIRQPVCCEQPCFFDGHAVGHADFLVKQTVSCVIEASNTTNLSQNQSCLPEQPQQSEARTTLI